MFADTNMSVGLNTQLLYMIWILISIKTVQKHL